MSTWDALGFEASPYNVEPLKVVDAHVNLLVGRGREGIDFCTIIDSAPQGVTVISGPPGVGKTSFFNIFQYLLEKKKAACGPALLAARTLCPLQADDDSRAVALRILQTLIRNVREYCQLNTKELPEQISKLHAWVNGRPSASWEFSISVLGNGGGFGRSVQIPALSESTFENFCDAITIIVDEVVNKVGLDGVFIGLDNVENLSDDRLAELMMAFRDTLFSVPRVWWVVIGQSGLYSLIQALDARVTDRIAGSGIELGPIGIDELHSAVQHRVEKFHSSSIAEAPLSNNLHRLLFEASEGEIHFVFKYSNTVCLHFVAQIRQNLLDKKIPISPQIVNRLIGEKMAEKHIPDKISEDILKGIVNQEFNGLGLKSKEKDILKKIGDRGAARSKEFDEFGLRSGQDFSSNYLMRFQEIGLLVRKQEGRAAIYKLRGLATLAAKFNLLT